MKKYILLIGLLLIVISSFSQKDLDNKIDKAIERHCYNDLIKAIEFYNNGLYEEAIDLLERRIKICEYKGSKKKQALKYLSAAYYRIDEIEKADKSTYSFLKKDPLYEAVNTDPFLFANALDKYKRYPSLSIGFKVGISKLNPYIKETYHIWDNADYTQDYSIKPSSNFTLVISKSLSQCLAINTDLTLSSYAYNRKIPLKGTDDFIKYDENFTELKIPLELSYSFKGIENFYMSIHTGIYYAHYTHLQASMRDSKLSMEEFTNFLNSSLSISKLRNIDNVGFTLGVGLNYRFNRFDILTKLAYSENLQNYTKKENNSISSQKFNVYYADDLFSISTLTFSVGFKYAIFYRIKFKYL